MVASARNDGLDLIRAVGAFLVFGTHLYHAYGQTWLGPFAAGGMTGIDLFFPLSGYLLYRPFVRGRVDVRRYAISRLARLAPAYYLAAVVMTIAAAPGMRDGWWVWATVSYNIFEPGFARFGQSWTLGVELAFYVLLPLLARLRHGITIALLGGVSMFAATQLSPDQWWTMQLPFHFWAFALGMLLARYEPRLAAVSRFALVPGGALVAGGVLLAGDGIGTAGWLVALGGTLLIAWAAATKPPLPWARWPADISYSVYLWHLFIAGVVFAPGLPGPVYVVVAVVATCAVAGLSWRFIEYPILRWASRRSVLRDPTFMQGSRGSFTPGPEERQAAGLSGG